MKTKNNFQKNIIKRTHDTLYLKENNYDNPKQIHSFILKTIISNLNLKNIKDYRGIITDFGPANGELLYNIKKKLPNAKLIGVEVLKDLVKKSKKKFLKEKNIKILLGSILDKKILKPKSNDISIACGVLSIFDDFEKFINNMIYFSKKGGKVYIAALFNNYPMDVYIKYKESKNYNKKYQESGWNIFSKNSVSNFLNKKRNIKKFYFKDFNIDINIKKNNNDYLRSWTFKDIAGERITTNGLSIILPTSLLCIELK